MVGSEGLHRHLVQPLPTVPNAVSAQAAGDSRPPLLAPPSGVHPTTHPGVGYPAPVSYR